MDTPADAVAAKRFERFARERRAAIDEVLDRLLPPGEPADVPTAMRYAVTAPGKRLRPLLTLAAHEACGGAPGTLLLPAAAIELIHAYSLVHDDLPAMDDDDLRRGRPTVHRAFDEARAILAGDALLTLAFELLASQPPEPEHAGRRAEAVRLVAHRAGRSGMVCGQAGDLAAEGRAVTETELESIHRHKTGALFAASAELGGLHAGAGPETRRALATFGEMLGLAFQIVDDLLDRTATAETLGKTPGKDDRAGKATYPALLGEQGARERAAQRVGQALGPLRELGLLTDVLQGLAGYALARTQ